MNEQTTTQERRVDAATLDAATELVNDAQTPSDVATVREMVSDQSGGETTITTESGETIDVKSIGQEKFAELGQEAIRKASENLPPNSEPWQTEEK